MSDLFDETLSEATWTAKFVDDLPDSSFAVIMPGGEKDEDDKTTPRSLRKLPYKDADGKVDLPHLRNAPSRLPQTKGVSASLIAKAKRTLEAEAKKALKSRQEESGADDVSENGDFAIYPPAPLAARSFADLAAMEAAQSSAEQVSKLTYQFTMLVNSVMGDDEVDDKISAISNLADEFVGLVERAMGELPASAEETPEEQPAAQAAEEPETMPGEADQPTAPVAQGDELAEASFSESDAGAAIAIAEDNQPEQNGVRAPLKLDVRLIKPGFGNKRDNHYYPPEVLRRDAHVFEGAKMYVTDHRQGEKSERTEVSVIEKITGFADDGAPIARVAVFDPEFAEKTRNRAALGQLATLECSILASGKTRKGKIDGADANIVEAITASQSVDWVTRAGAGGQAVAIAEGEQGVQDQAQPMNLASEPHSDQDGGGANGVQDEGQDKEKQGQGQAQAQAVGDVQGSDKPQARPAGEGQPAEAQLEQQAPIAEATLSEGDIKAELDKRPGLPTALKARIVGRAFKTSNELREAIDHEVEYYKALTGSGQPFAQGSARLVESAPLADEERKRRGEERFKRIMREVGA